MKRIFAEVAVELPIDRLFSYSVPEHLSAEALVGRRVLVPFGPRVVTGYITELTPAPPASIPPDAVKKIKAITDVLDEGPLFGAKRLKFYRWLSTYYFAPLGTVLSLINPADASIKSFRYFSLTDEGAAATESGLSQDILGAAVKGVSLSTLLKRFKRAPLHSTIARLKREGLITEELRLTKGGTQKVERILTLADPKAPMPEKLLKRSPLQGRVYAYLAEKGESPIKLLQRDIGPVSGAVRRLNDKGLIRISVRRVLRDPLADITPRASDHEPNSEQKAAIKKIAASIDKSVYSPFLLYGVTGSGKTLVYLKVLEDVLKAGKKALFLVPEIALTPWPVAYLAKRFPGRVALAHSGLGAGERLDEWSRIVKGEAEIVVGTRSALFSPIKDLSLIVVDEEHDTSYKQEEGVKYNGRDAALMLSKFLGITVVLGSATPSVETFYNAKTGKLTPLFLKKRVADATLPATELVDMRGLKHEVISERLKSKLAATVSDGNQAILFLNRRGFSNSIICRDCGFTFSCLNCSVTLTLHKKRKALVCHYCDFSLKVPDECPECASLNLVNPGAGTEKVEEEVKAIIDTARVVRMDRDTTGSKGAAKRIIDAVEAGETDVLVGTQMVSKGHHFPGIALVGIISGDTSLNIPDFRSAERTFQLVTQAAGRAGRGSVAGSVLIQTLNPSHPCLKSALTHDYEAFYAEEIKNRDELSYPPFTRLCSLRVEGQGEAGTQEAALMLKKLSDGLLSKKSGGPVVLGPAPALLAKLKGRYRWQLLIKGADVKELHSFVRRLKHGFEAKGLKSVTLGIDMDPLSIV